MPNKQKIGFIRIIVLISVMAGCGKTDFEKITLKPKVKMPETNISPEFHDIIQEFLDDSEHYEVLLPNLWRLREVSYEVLTDDRAGYCTKYTKDGKFFYSVIKISDEYKEQDPLRLKALLYHELGHCVLDKEHSTEISIMYPYILSTLTYKNNWNSFLDTFFNN